MSIFASYIQATIPIPFDPPHTVTVRKLTGREIEAAQEAHRGSIASGSSRSWARTFRRMLELGASDPEVLKAVADPLTGYDRFALVKAGLVNWSYPHLISAQAGPVVLPKGEKPAPVDRQKHIDDLDDEAVDFIATEVLRLTKPGLFAETVAEAEKNASAPSIAS